MVNNIIAFVAALIFALGLGISGMTQPQKVIGFLDIFGNWDPSLAFVMAGAISVHWILSKFIMKRTSPLFSTRWHLPEKTKITKSLIAGSTIFGIGWGLAGYCPGPALTALFSFQARPALFVVGMLAGMSLFRILDEKIKFNR
jgi:uncharacterized protein